jgi:hypothetical protein
MADQLNETRRHLSAKQGDRKMLSEQVGDLAGRINGLAASSAEEAH